MITLSFKGMEKLHIGFDKYWYGTDYLKADHDLIWGMNAFVGSIFWPVTWLIIVMAKGSSKIINLIVEEIEDTKEQTK